MYLTSDRFCSICSRKVITTTFPSRGDICLGCEVENAPNLTKKGRLMYMGHNKKDVYRSAIGSGYFPVSFNFILCEDTSWIQCSYCGCFVHYKVATRDHVYPKSRGGIIKTPACSTCNEAKEDKLPIEWAIFAYQNNLDIAKFQDNDDTAVA